MSNSKINPGPYFDGVIGQNLAKERLIQSVQSSLNGGPMISPLISGDAGSGKTHIAMAYCRALEDAGYDVLCVHPEEFRLSDTVQPVIDILQSPNKFALWIDEIHEIDFKQTVSLARVKKILMKILDKTNHGKVVDIGGDETVVFDPTKGTIIGTTNFPGKLDKSGAFQSRFAKFELDLYSEGELVEILKVMLANTGFTHLNDKTLTMIARCGRGTARPMANIVQALDMGFSASGKSQKVVNRDEVLRALKNTRMYPMGLSVNEVALLNKARGVRMLDRIIMASMPRIEPQELRKSKGYLLSVDFLHDTSCGVTTTPKGVRFLENIRGDGFEIPHI